MSRFCNAPWISISTDVNGSVRPCCRYEQPGRQTEYIMPNLRDGTIDKIWNGKELKRLRQAFLDGKEPAECNWCWSEEVAGLESFRQRYMARPYEYTPTVDNVPAPQIYDLKLSNVCNLKCRMCSPQASSSILKEMKELGATYEDETYWLSNKILGTKNESVFMESWVPQMQELEVTGGEPFFSSENKQLLTRIVDSGHAEHINLLITTNGMFYDRKLIEKISRFRRVTFSLSIDDVGERLEYARSGSSWKTIQTNILNLIKEYRSERLAINIYRTINIFNVWYLKELDDFAMDHNIEVISGMLHSPKPLCISYLPYWVKEEITARYASSNMYAGVLDFMNTSDMSFMIDLKEKIDTLDKIRKESFRKTFPEWSQVLLYE